MSTPSVPPRPQRTQAGHTAVKTDSPLLPPRPIRNIDPSADREAYTRSPLNNPPTSTAARQVRTKSSQDLPRRPPSVALPDIGHEGDEYSSFDQLPDEAHGVSVGSDSAASAEQTRNVSVDLPMHQPKASVPQSTATRQIETVTRTDSTQAAAAGIGHSHPVDDVHKASSADVGTGTASPLPRPASTGRRDPSNEPTLRMRSSFNRSTSSLQPIERTTSRPASIHGDDHEHGIPLIGQHVPLLAMAGDVQAPTPSPSQQQHPRGIGFFNDGNPRNHTRKRSSRQEFGLSDSYGLHHDHPDQLEMEWIRKHPQQAAREGIYNHLPRPESALSSDQLNRLVHQSDDATTTGSVGTPDENTADDYLQCASSATTSPAPADRKKRSSSGAQAQPGSPMRKSGFLQSHLHPGDAMAMDDEFGAEHRTPILAQDEILKRPSSAYMHAAVVPDPDSHHDEYYDSDTGSRKNPSSRPSSRPSSTHGGGNLQGYQGGSLHRFVSHEEQHHSGMGTPLEEIEEYEPLFPEEEGQGKAQAAPKLSKRRPELAQHHFPSSDVWEDTPSSLQYSAEVSTPELEHVQRRLGAEQAASTAFETPEAEAKRRAQTNEENDMTSDNKTFVRPQFKAGVVEEMHRPSAHRFPSSDVWEDSPDSFTLVNQTTVSDLSEEDATAQEDDRANRPLVPATRPLRKSKLAEEEKPPEDNVQRDIAVKSPPAVPAKPTVPARPQRPSRGAQDGTADAVETVKVKPVVPARPGGEKIASLKAGFMSDLNNRLKLGPQAPPAKKEPEAETNEEEVKSPLADARKSRAKGPARRKPATAPNADRRSSITFAFSPLINCWSIDEEDELQVHNAEKAREAAAMAAAGPDAEEDTSDAQTAAVQDIATEISHADKPWEAARRHRDSTTGLKAALAEAGVAPSSYAEESTEDVTVQTGEEQTNKTTTDSPIEKVTSAGHESEEDKSIVAKGGEEVQ